MTHPWPTDPHEKQGNYYVQRLEISQIPKTRQQLKEEAQYERRRCAQRTRYSLEPGFTMPDTIQLVPVQETSDDCEDLPTINETSISVSTGEKTIEVPEIEITLNPVEQRKIEEDESDLPEEQIVSNRARKKRLWLSKLQKKKST